MKSITTCLRTFIYISFTLAMGCGPKVGAQTATAAKNNMPHNEISSPEDLALAEAKAEAQRCFEHIWTQTGNRVVNCKVLTYMSSKNRSYMNFEESLLGPTNIYTRTLTDADRLNGIEYSITFRFRPTALRTLEAKWPIDNNADLPQWGQWKSDISENYFLFKCVVIRCKGKLLSSGSFCTPTDLFLLPNDQADLNLSDFNKMDAFASYIKLTPGLIPTEADALPAIQEKLSKLTEMYYKNK